MVRAQGVQEVGNVSRWTFGTGVAASVRTAPLADAIGPRRVGLIQAALGGTVAAMKRIGTIAVIGGIAGLVVGYLIFGTIGGRRVGLEALFSFGVGTGVGNAIRRVAADAVGLSEIRRNILLTGLLAAAVSAVVAVFRPGRRR